MTSAMSLTSDAFQAEPCRQGMGKMVPPPTECSVSMMKLVGMPRRLLLTCQRCQSLRADVPPSSGYVAPRPVLLYLT